MDLGRQDIDRNICEQKKNFQYNFFINYQYYISKLDYFLKVVVIEIHFSMYTLNLVDIISIIICYLIFKCDNLCVSEVKSYHNKLFLRWNHTVFLIINCIHVFVNINDPISKCKHPYQCNHWIEWHLSITDTWFLSPSSVHYSYCKSLTKCNFTYWCKRVLTRCSVNTLGK